MKTGTLNEHAEIDSNWKSERTENREYFLMLLKTLDYHPVLVPRHGMTFGEIAEVYGVSKQRIEQIFHKAMEKLRNRHGGKPYDPNRKTKHVIQIDVKTKQVIKVFNSARLASESTGVNRGNISQVCGGHMKSAGGYEWRYVK